MAPKATWKGFLSVSLVSMGVKAYSATSASGGPVRLNQLHHACHQRIQHRKTCAHHGPVTSDEIVMGYEYGQDQYVVVDPAELDQLRSDEEKRAIRIDRFVPENQVSFLYFTDKHYYLLPDGAAADLPYALLKQAMEDKHVEAIGQVVLCQKEQLVLVRTLEDLFTMTVLKYASQVRLPAGLRDQREPTSAPLGKQELSLAGKLIQSRSCRKLDLAQYTDQYTEKLTRLIEAKVRGEQLVAPSASRPSAALNLIEALRASVDDKPVTRNGAGVVPDKPRRGNRRATNGRPTTGPQRKKKPA